MGVKSLHAESPRFPAQRSSAQGESAPKARQRCVADGKLVNIPAPSYSAMGGRIAEGHQGVGRHCCCIEEGALGKSVSVTQGCGTRSQVDRSDWKWFQEKPLSFSCTRPYRKPTQVDGMNIPRRLRELRRRNSAN